MPNFAYEAVNDSGKKVKGTVRALNKQSAIMELRNKGYMIRSVQERAATVMDAEISVGKAVKLQDFVIFCRQFATLIRSGIQIDQALGILEAQSASKRLKLAIGEVSDQIRNGHNLSKGMGDHPKIFPAMFVNMVASGETGGNLDEVLDRMADHYEKEHKTIQKVKSAMTYPIIVLIIAIAVVIFLLLKIVPTFTELFNDQGATLPWITRFVMGASNAVAHYWWMFLIVLTGAVLMVRSILSTEEGKLLRDKLKFRIPVFGAILKKSAVARMARTMSSLFMGAVPIIQILEVTEQVVGNRLLGAVLREARDSLQQGKLLSEPFTKSGLFPPMVTQMLIIGEETGQVDKMLSKVADFYETDVDQSVDRLKSVVEPLMLLIVGCIVGIIVAAIMSPMFKMYENMLN